MKKTTQDLISGGMRLSFGSSAIDKLPDSATKAGVQSGIGQAGKFFPIMTNIHMAGYVTNKLKKLKGR